MAWSCSFKKLFGPRPGGQTVASYFTGPDGADRFFATLQFSVRQAMDRVCELSEGVPAIERPPDGLLSKHSLFARHLRLGRAASELRVGFTQLGD